MYPYILDSFTGKTLFQLNKYYNLNLLNELFGVIIPHGFDMGNIGFIQQIQIIFKGGDYRLTWLKIN